MHSSVWFVVLFFFCRRVMNFVVAMCLFKEDKIKGICSALEAEGGRDSGVPYFL